VILIHSLVQGSLKEVVGLAAAEMKSIRKKSSSLKLKSFLKWSKS